MGADAHRVGRQEQRRRGRSAGGSGAMRMPAQSAPSAALMGGSPACTCRSHPLCSPWRTEKEGEEEQPGGDERCRLRSRRKRSRQGAA